VNHEFINSLLTNYYLKSLFLLLFNLGSVAAPGLLPVGNALGVIHSADHFITDTRQILGPSAFDHYDRVLLQIMTDTGNIGSNFHAVRKSYTGDLTQRGIRFFRSSRSNFKTNPPLERRSFLQFRPLLMESV